MSTNEATTAAIQEYLNLESPEYAIMIDAPWGAGKTHFVKETCHQQIAAKECRYVTLNGVSDSYAFRQAVLKDDLKGKAASSLTGIVNSLGEAVNLNNLGSMVREMAENQLLEKLPTALIFDDIERTTINPTELFGLINDFVEHRGKNVILVVHSEKHPNTTEFLAKQEKLVGRTLKIVADFDAAYPTFLMKIKKGKGKDFFSSHEALVAEVFKQAGHQNLRLLRNALRECAILLDRVEDDLFKAKEPMARFVKTYLALNMAIAKGEIRLDDLSERNDGYITSKSKAEDGNAKEAVKRLYPIYARHEGSDIYVSTNATAMPILLPQLLFKEGYASTEQLNTILKATGEFIPKEENPLWRRIMRWGDKKTAELEEILKEAEEYLFDKKLIEPGPYLHIAATLLRIQEYGGLEISKDALVKKILLRIKYLEEHQGLPPAKLGVGFGWELIGTVFAYGGCFWEIESSDLQKIVEAMQQAQLRTYQLTIPNVAHEIEQSFKEDLTLFLKKLDDSNYEVNWYRAEVFQHVDLDEFAKTALEHLKSGDLERLGAVFELLHERHHQDGKWRDEKNWFQALRSKMQELAGADSPLVKAQLKCFLILQNRIARRDK